MYYVLVVCTVFFFGDFRTVIEGGAGRNYCCRTKKEQIRYAKVSSATASAHWDQRKLYSEIESQTKNVNLPRNPKP